MTTLAYAVRRPGMVAWMLAYFHTFIQGVAAWMMVQAELAYHPTKRYVTNVAVFLGLASREVDGNAQARIVALILGVVVIMIGMIVAGILDQTAADAGKVDKPIGSFAGAKPLNNLIPTLIRVVLVIVGVGMIGIGTAGFARMGPMGR